MREHIFGMLLKNITMKIIFEGTKLWSFNQWPHQKDYLNFIINFNFNKNNLFTAFAGLIFFFFLFFFFKLILINIPLSPQSQS